MTRSCSRSMRRATVEVARAHALMIEGAMTGESPNWDEVGHEFSALQSEMARIRPQLMRFVEKRSVD